MKTMMSCGFAAFVLVCTVARATSISVPFSGIIDSANERSEFLGRGVGDIFTGTFYYDPVAWDAGLPNGYYRGNAGLGVVGFGAGGGNTGLRIPLVLLFQDGVGSLTFGAEAQGAAGMLSIAMSFTYDSAQLGAPQTMTVTGGTVSGFSGSSWMQDMGVFSGTITIPSEPFSSLRRPIADVPDKSSSALLLSFGVLAIVIHRRFIKASRRD